jgi:DNA-binding winged helix-turn-helix (wHTH) protein
MQPATVIVFPPFRLDRANERLWCGEQPIHLRPKTFAVLQCLLEHPGQLLTKSALLNTVWPETVVSEAVLLGCIRDLRRVLRDDPRRPQFIETVHRRGYRFIGSITETAGSDVQYDVDVSLQQTIAQHPQLPGAGMAYMPETMVGRDAEVTALHQYLHAALEGTRQIVFVTGEAGLGKTTLVEAFVAEAGHLDSLWVGRGQCVEHFGVGEAYMPVLEALGQICRSPEGYVLIDVLAHYAPTWLVQMPWLLSAVDLERLQRSLWGSTRERMLREMAQALEVLTVERPLVLVLEDLHWSDHATLDLLSVLARRQEPARLLLLGTYRPEDSESTPYRPKAKY